MSLNTSRARQIEARMRLRRCLHGVKVCNCAESGNLLLGRSTPEEVIQAHAEVLPPKLEHVIDGRPYCSDCKGVAS